MHIHIPIPIHIHIHIHMYRSIYIYTYHTVGNLLSSPLKAGKSWKGWMSPAKNRWMC